MYEPATDAVTQSGGASASVAPMGERHSQQQLAASAAITREQQCARCCPGCLLFT